MTVTTDFDVFFAEEELSVEVGCLYGVHVSDGEFARALLAPSRDAHHGEVFEVLAPDGPSPHDEGINALHLSLHFVSKHFHLPVVSRAALNQKVTYTSDPCTVSEHERFQSTLISIFKRF